MTHKEKSINIKLKATNPKQAKIIEFLEDKPVTYIFTEALEMYMKAHEHMHTIAIQSIISEIQSGTNKITHNNTKKDYKSNNTNTYEHSKQAKLFFNKN